MKNRFTEWKLSITAFITALSALLGWQGILILLWLSVMTLDYISGSLAAWMRGEWSSAVARSGIRHKAGMIFVVIVAALADITLMILCSQLPLEISWPVLVLPLVLAWYILTELGSILENAVKLGAPIPEWLRKILSVGLSIINAKGNEFENTSQ